MINGGPMNIKEAFDAAIEAEKKDLRGLYPMAARVLAVEAKNLIANLENERQHVLDMREGVRLGGEYAREVVRLRGFIQQEAEKIRETAKHFEKIGGCGNPYAAILNRGAKRYEDALLPPVEGESKEGGENVDL